MIAPEPSLAGPRPAAASREAVRPAEPDRHGEGAFDIVLQAVEDEADPEAPVAGEPPAPEAVAPPPPDPAMALAVMLPAVSAVPADVAPSAAAPAPAVAAQGPVAVPDASGAPVRASGAPAAEVPPPEPADEAQEASSRPDVEAMPSAAPLRRLPAPAAPLFTAAAEMPREVSDAPPVRVEAAPRAEMAVPPPARPVAAAPAPIEGDRAVEGVSLRDAAPPAWHLAPDPGPGPARPEAAAQPQPPVQAPAAASPQAVAGQVAVAIGRASDERVEIRLDPPELGRVQIHLTRHDGAIQAVVLADRPETQDLLRRHAEVLARELGEAGYDNVSLDFGGGEAQARRDEAPGVDWAEARPVQAAAPEAAPTAPALRRLAAGLLDIRL